ncbi:unnamed protein product [Gadus morhua 'NCC']
MTLGKHPAADSFLRYSDPRLGANGAIEQLPPLVNAVEEVPAGAASLRAPLGGGADVCRGSRGSRGTGSDPATRH